MRARELLTERELQIVSAVKSVGTMLLQRENMFIFNTERRAPEVGVNHADSERKSEVCAKFTTQ